MGTVRVGDDIDIYFEEQGSGEPLLLIMGLAADSQAWLFQMPEFAQHFRTIAFDNRGVGRSDKPAGPYTIHQMPATPSRCSTISASRTRTWSASPWAA